MIVGSMYYVHLGRYESFRFNPDWGSNWLIQQIMERVACSPANTM